MANKYSKNIALLWQIRKFGLICHRNFKKLTYEKSKKIRLEYMLKAGSGNIVWSIISTPSGLETWFADKVTFKDKVFTFYWGKNRNTAS